MSRDYQGTPTEKAIKKSLLDLLGKEFGFKRYDEHTGLVSQTNTEKDHQYRGFTLWLKEVLETILAWVMVLCFVGYGFQLVGAVKSGSTDQIESLMPKILAVAGGFLLLDSILLIAALIASPGIDETVDSISVSIAAVFVLTLGRFDPRTLIQQPSLSYTFMIPLALIVVVLIATKHLLRNRSEGQRIHRRGSRVASRHYTNRRH